METPQLHATGPWTSTGGTGRTVEMEFEFDGVPFPSADWGAPTSPASGSEEEMVPVLPADLQTSPQVDLDEVAATVAAMAGVKPEEVDSVLFTPRGQGQDVPAHHAHTGLGCLADYSIFTKGPNGELVMTSLYSKSRQFK
jgi:hypothetical protein